MKLDERTGHTPISDACRDAPTHLRCSAMALYKLLVTLGFEDDQNKIIDRGSAFAESLGSEDVAAALGDDLDAHSVAVGLSAALGIYAACAGKADALEKQRQEAKQQRRKAKLN